MTEELFQFIQWEDEEPYNIAELIEEYEKYKKASDYFKVNIKNVNQSMLDDLPTESEETEVKRNLKEAILGIEVTQFDGQKADLEELVNPRQLEEIINDWMPGVLSSNWIKDNQLMWTSIHGAEYYVPANKLYGKLVPKLELPVIPQSVADWIESRDYYNVYKVLKNLSASGSPHASKDVRNWIFCNQENVEKFVRAWLDGYEVEEEEQKYIVKLPLPGNKTNDFAVVDIYGDIWIDDEWPNHCKMTEKEIKDLPKGEVYFEHFAVKAEELEE